MTGRLLHYATYFDRHFLARGLALHRSLCRHSPPFRLWVLCLDGETERVLRQLRLEQAELLPLAELERADPPLPAVKPTRQTVEYYWTCTAPWLLHLLRRQPQIDRLAYVDADLLFFHDPTPLWDELGTGSVLLIEHRRSRFVAPRSRQLGTYNVGLLLFRRTAESQACLERWREQCLEWCFRRLEGDRFGDQKYLDEWPERYPTTIVSQLKGAGVGPWNVGRYRFGRPEGQVVVDGEPLLFYHFSHLRAITGWLYDSGVWVWNTPLDPAVKRWIYLPYVRELRAARRLIEAAGGILPPTDSIFKRDHRLQLLAQTLWHRSFVVATDSAGGEEMLPRYPA